MRIDNNRANFDRVDSARMPAADAATKRDGTRKTDSGDSVRVSPVAQFATSAVTAAAGAPEIRQHKVERAKALLADGTLGNDPFKLADALIDRAIAKE